MDNENLSSEIEQRARELCEQISVAHDLDAEIQQELYTHVEDKLLGYLSGEVPVTQDDALILVREHFGDIRTIKSLMQDVHAVEVTASKARKLAAAAIVTLVCLFAGRLLTSIITIGLRYNQIRLMTPAEVSTAMTPNQDISGIDLLPPILAVILFLTLGEGPKIVPWIFFRRWQGSSVPIRTRWFCRWSGWKLAFVIVALFGLHALLPYTWGIWDFSSLLGFNVGAILLMSFLMSGFTVLQMMSWVWWCDKPPRMKLWVWWCDKAPIISRIIPSTMLAFLVVPFGLALFPRMSARIYPQIYQGAEEYPGRLYIGPFFNTDYFWFIDWSMPIFEAFPAFSVTLFFMVPICAAVAYQFLATRRTRGATDDPDELA